MSRRMVAPAIPIEELTEKQFEQQLIGSKTKPGVARLLGWRCYHTLRSKGSEAGYPDWTLVRERVVFLELKREAGTVSDAQREWLRALERAGAEVYIVRPRHLDAITAVLRSRSRADVTHQLDELETELAQLHTPTSHSTERTAAA